jgi:hypothetical protein
MADEGLHPIGDDGRSLGCGAQQIPHVLAHNIEHFAVPPVRRDRIDGRTAVLLFALRPKQEPLVFFPRAFAFVLLRVLVEVLAGECVPRTGASTLRLLVGGIIAVCDLAANRTHLRAGFREREMIDVRDLEAGVLAVARVRASPRLLPGLRDQHHEARRLRIEMLFLFTGRALHAGAPGVA